MNWPKDCITYRTQLLVVFLYLTIKCYCPLDPSGFRVHAALSPSIYLYQQLSRVFSFFPVNSCCTRSIYLIPLSNKSTHHEHRCKISTMLQDLEETALNPNLIDLKLTQFTAILLVFIDKRCIHVYLNLLIVGYS